MTAILDTLFVISFLVALVAFAIAMAALLRHGGRIRIATTDPNEKRAIRKLVTAMSLIGAVFIVGFLAAWSARGDIRRLAETAAEAHVRIGGQAAIDPSALLAALRGISWSAHGRIPGEDPVTVDIESTLGSLRLELHRDPRYPESRWVFVPAHWFSRQNQVGWIRITDAALQAATSDVVTSSTKNP